MKTVFQPRLSAIKHSLSRRCKMLQGKKHFPPSKGMRAFINCDCHVLILLTGRLNHKRIHTFCWLQFSFGFGVHTQWKSEAIHVSVLEDCSHLHTVLEMQPVSSPNMHSHSSHWAISPAQDSYTDTQQIRCSQKISCKVLPKGPLN